MTDLEKLKNRIVRGFAPDISFTFDKKFGNYIMKGITEAGHLFIKKRTGVRMDCGKLVGMSIVDEVYDSALRIGLTCERTDREDLDD